MKRLYLKWRRKIRGRWYDWSQRSHRDCEGVCMCGSSVDGHSYGDGHSPVDMWHYYRDEFVYRGEK